MFTIVIPVYNRERLIIRLLDSIVAQTLRPLSVIIVDNASTDNTYQRVEEWVSANNNNGIDFTLLKESKPGATSARNCGLNAVKTPYMCFFDSDDTIRPHFAETLLNKFLSPEAPDIVLYKSINHRVDGKTGVLSPSVKNLYRNHIIHGTLATQAYAARTEIFHKAGAWNPEALIWDDWELGIRILRIPELTVSNPTSDILAEKYDIEESITGTSFADKTDQLDKVLSFAAQDVADDNYSLSLIQLVRARLAGRIRREGDKSSAKKILANLRCKNRLCKIIIYGVYYHTILFKRGSALWAEPLLRLLNKNQ